jgi:hypothetical protein
MTEEIPTSLADLDAHGAEAGKPRVQAGSDPATIRAVIDAINGGKFPEVFVTNGRVVHIEEISGAEAAITGEEDSPLPVEAVQVDRHVLANLLARHTFTYRLRPKPGRDSDGEYEEETKPAGDVLSAALALRNWPGLGPLHGVAAAPLVRPDGTLLQDPGYDEATGLFLASKIPLDRVPDEPTSEQVEHARGFLLDEFLPDFPWVEDADRANYIALLATPILRRFIRSVIPFAVFTATMPSSGKTILTSGPGMLYGQRVVTWPDDDKELTKVITSVLADPVGAVIFDNLPEGAIIKSPVLARLLTDRSWSDRLLGGNVIANYANDRLWCATGNNLRLGGDMATRTVLVRLDPDMAHPEERDQSKFGIPNLDQWILKGPNQRRVLWNLLVLIIDWIRKGAARERGVNLRQFTPWAEFLAGFLAHHQIKGFLANIESSRGIDDEDAMWAAFLARFRKIHGGARLTANELHLSADVPPGGLDLWDGLFINGARGKPLSAPALGMRLKGQIGHHRSCYVLRSDLDRHSGVHTYWVEERTE